MTVVHAVRGHVTDARVAVHGVVPGEERLAVRPCILDAAKARREVRPVLHRFELRRRVRVVVADVRAAVALGDARIGQQRGHRLGAHAGTLIGVQGQHAWLNVMARDGLRNQLPGQLGALARGDQPAHHVPAKDVQDHVEVETPPTWPAP